MTTTLDPPLVREPAPAPAPTTPEDFERQSGGRDNWAIMMFGVAIIALIFSVIAVGFGLRAVDEAKHPAAAPAPAPAVAAVPAAPAVLNSVTLGDMKVTPSSTVVVSGKYTVNITNSGMMAHELLVFHTDIAAANLPVGADGKVAEDAPGFMISDGENLDPGASQSRVIDLSQPGTYLFVCNLPGHFAAGMHTTVTVK